MPVYTVRNNSTEEYYDVNMSFQEFENFLIDNPNMTWVPQMPASITGRMSTQRMAGSGWQDVLKKVKSASGKDSKIDV